MGNFHFMYPASMSSRTDVDGHSRENKTENFGEDLPPILFLEKMKVKVCTIKRAEVDFYRSVSFILYDE